MNIYDTVGRIKRMAEQLVPYNFPTVSPQDEEIINFLKFTEATVDGYDVILHFNKHDYGDHYLETFQVLGKEVPFLPFVLICKLAKLFLGEQKLSLVEVLKDGRKIYCWTLIRDKKGKAIAAPYQNKGEDCSYEGFQYSYVTPDKINFY